MDLQLRLVSGWGLWTRKSAPPYGPLWLGKDFDFFRFVRCKYFMTDEIFSSPCIQLAVKISKWHKSSLDNFTPWYNFPWLYARITLQLYNVESTLQCLHDCYTAVEAADRKLCSLCFVIMSGLSRLNTPPHSQCLHRLDIGTAASWNRMLGKCALWDWPPLSRIQLASSSSSSSLVNYSLNETDSTEKQLENISESAGQQALKPAMLTAAKNNRL